MNLNNQKTTINDVTNAWVKYIEAFHHSNVTIANFRDRGYSWSKIETIFIQAVENKQEIQLSNY